jgi:hypothetical protein
LFIHNKESIFFLESMQESSSDLWVPSHVFAGDVKMGWVSEEGVNEQIAVINGQGSVSIPDFPCVECLSSQGPG